MLAPRSRVSSVPIPPSPLLRPPPFRSGRHHTGEKVKGPLHRENHLVDTDGSTVGPSRGAGRAYKDVFLPGTGKGGEKVLARTPALEPSRRASASRGLSFPWAPGVWREVPATPRSTSPRRGCLALGPQRESALPFTLTLGEARAVSCSCGLRAVPPEGVTPRLGGPGGPAEPEAEPLTGARGPPPEVLAHCRGVRFGFRSV